jgi:4-amino-4-deoxychorismate lyase
MSAPLASWLDGEPLNAAWSLDRGLHYGDGLFETMIVRNGRIRFAAAHQQRLQQGCQRLDIDCDAAAALQQAQSLAGAGDALLKLIVTRGLATERGYAPAGNERARQLLLRYPLPAGEAGDQAPMRLALLPVTLGENPLLAGIKHLNRLELVLASAARRARGCDEGLLCSSSGHLACGTSSNVFLVSDGRLLTPRVDRCGIAGVLRSVVLREAHRLGLPAQEQDLAPALLASAAEIFITNVRLGVRIATEVDGRVMPPAPWAQALQQRIATLED